MTKIAITGKPGIGKTTFCLKVFNALKHECKVCGFITAEIREKNKRIGFKIRNLETNEEDWLAKVGKGKITVGKYVVFVENIKKFLASLDCNGIVILDEVGPMELKSRDFVRKVSELINKNNPMLFSIHFKSKHPLLEKIRKSFEVIVLNEKNRNVLVNRVIERLKNAFEARN